ncbi:hypothetical protein FOCC_FOCC017537 [Frankliniella occidentalis]|nr:hypothetical protein FOCC_FOCC017537 [Frankliniella occidentalis]
MLSSLAANYSVCFASPVHRIDKQDFTDEEATNVVLSLNSSEAKIVIVFSESFQSSMVRLLLKARDLDVLERFTWVFSDLWTDKFSERADRESRDDLRCRHTFIDCRKNNSNFTVDHVSSSPGGWQAKLLEGSICVHPMSRQLFGFDEYFMSLKLDHQQVNPWWTELWRSHFGCRDDESTKARYLHFVRDAIWAVAQALTDLQRDRCGGEPGMYSVLNYQRTIGAASSPASAAGPPRYGWVSVGDYTMNEDGSGPHLHVDSASIRSRADAPLPSSTCTPTCRAGQIKTRAVRQNDWTCEDCPAGSRPTPDHLQCLLVPEEHIGYTHPWAIAAMAVASFGLVATVLVSAVFWTHRNTPVIKAAGRELSALLLVAELASYLVTFVMVAPPTNATCGLTRFALGFCFTLSYTSPGSQLVITALLTSVEALINLAWLTYEPARVRDHFPSRDVRQRICVGLDNYSYLVGLIYPLVLIGLCVVYAVKTRKCPGGFNETRHIAFTTYTVTIIWLAFVPLYLASTSTALRTVTLAMSLSLSGLVQLGCLFCPKVYIVILKPEKNTKEVVMMSTCHRTLGSTGTLPAHHLTTNPAAALVKARLEGRSPCPSELGSDMSPAMAGSLADHDEALSLSH